MRVQLALLAFALHCLREVASFTGQRAAGVSKLPESQTFSRDSKPGASSAEVLAGDAESLAKLGGLHSRQ